MDAHTDNDIYQINVARMYMKITPLNEIYLFFWKMRLLNYCLDAHYAEESHYSDIALF